jgi:hypothetical protein
LRRRGQCPVSGCPRKRSDRNGDGRSRPHHLAGASELREHSSRSRRACLIHAVSGEMERVPKSRQPVAGAVAHRPQARCGRHVYDHVAHRLQCGKRRAWSTHHLCRRQGA